MWHTVGNVRRSRPGLNNQCRAIRSEFSQPSGRLNVADFNPQEIRPDTSTVAAVMPPPTGHGGQTRGLTSGSQDLKPGRFARMFDSALDRPRFDLHLLESLADLMTGIGGDLDKGKPIREMPGSGGTTIEPSDPGDENPTIPAGYTYFSQFVDHDMTFDPTPLNDQTVDPKAQENFRTPALDLDSVYGTGPANQPYLYRFDGAKTFLRIGADISGGVANAAATQSRHDHLRLAAENPADPVMKCAAVLGDKRNDENKIVAQVHTAIIALHNKVMADDHLLLSMGSFDINDVGERFKMAVKMVRWHYQWVVLFDMARDRFCEPGMVDEVLNPTGAMPRLGHYLSPAPGFAYIPIEFAVAGYRMGHSMVRPTYALNEFVGVSDSAEHTETRVPIFKPNGRPKDAMNGFGQAVPGSWGIDWSFFLDGLAPPAVPAGEKPLAIPQPSYRIDASLVDPLRLLPEFEGLPVPIANLAFRNLKRSQLNQLPSGEAVAEALGIVPMSFDDVWWAGSGTRTDSVDDDRTDLAARRKAFGDAHRTALEHHTPLWYYLLREAERFGTQRTPGTPDPFGGQHMGPVGSRILAETFVGLLWMDKNSFLHAQAKFRPFLGLGHALPAGRRYTLSDLFRFALS